jgi:hypothetical protein
MECYEIFRNLIPDDYEMSSDAQSPSDPDPFGNLTELRSDSEDLSARLGGGKTAGAKPAPLPSPTAPGKAAPRRRITRKLSPGQSSAYRPLTLGGSDTPLDSGGGYPALERCDRPGLRTRPRAASRGRAAAFHTGSNASGAYPGTEDSANDPPEGCCSPMWALALVGLWILSSCPFPRGPSMEPVTTTTTTTTTAAQHPLVFQPWFFTFSAAL